MEMNHVVMIIVPVIAGIFGWVGNHISNQPKREDTNLNRIEFIVSNYEKLNDQCEGRVKRLSYENKVLRDKNRHLKSELKKKGAE